MIANLPVIQNHYRAIILFRNPVLSAIGPGKLLEKYMWKKQDRGYTQAPSRYRKSACLLHLLAFDTLADIMSMTNAAM
jgi:hypothetical protein